jgi:hypothetical protein
MNSAPIIRPFKGSKSVNPTSYGPTDDQCRYLRVLPSAAIDLAFDGVSGYVAPANVETVFACGARCTVAITNNATVSFAECT